MKCYKFENTHGSYYITAFTSDIGAEIEEAEEGEVFTITVIEMTEKKFNELPEFDGF